MNSRIRSGIFDELLNRSLAAHFNVGIAILAFGIFLLGLLWGIVTFKIHAEKGEEIQGAMKHTANLARVIEEHTVRTIREAEQLLLFIMDLRREQGAKIDLRRIMEDGPLISRIYTYLSIIDEQGMLAAGSAPFTPIDLSDREHFRVHVAQDTGRLFISKPEIGRASGKQSIQLTRRINKPDLTFGGVAVASVDPAYFSQFYGQLDLGKQGVVTLIGRNDGIIRARRAGADTTIGQDVRNTPLFSHLQTSKHGSYESVSTVAGVRRIVSYRSVADYPLVIFVAVGAGEALAAFNERVRHYYEAAALVSLVILAFTALLLLMVSRRTKAEMALRESDRRLRGLVESVVEGVISVDAQQVIVLFNPAAAQMFGRSSEEMVGLPLSALIPGRFRPQHDEQVRRFAATGETRRAMGKYGLIYGLRANGEEFPIEATISVSGRPPDTLLTVILRDVTERLRAEAERKRLLDALEASLNEIYIFDIDTLRFRYVNQSAQRNLGYNAEALRAMTPLDIKPEFSAASFRELIAPLLRREKQVLVFQTVHRRADESLYPVEVHLQLAGDETQRAFLAVIFDITERRRGEQALRGYTEQLRQLSRRLFKAEENERRRLARELHDRIGQNVTALSLSLNMLRAELPADYRQKLKAHLDDFDSLLASTSKLVRDVLVDLRPPGLDELGLLAALNEHARQVAGRVTFTVTVNGSEVTPRLPAAAEIMLFRIAQEALTNIAKHAQATAVTLTLEPGPDTVVLTIADNGRGINVTPATAQAQSRSSLGMVSMRERAESIGATLHVESLSGRGTRVIVEAPRTAPDADDQPHLPGTEAAQDLGVWSPAGNIRKDSE